jgi:hypothetical protein
MENDTVTLLRFMNATHADLRATMAANHDVVCLGLAVTCGLGALASAVVHYWHRANRAENVLQDIENARKRR